MAQPARVTLVLGTRPEAIKMAPVIRAFQQSDRFDARVVLTGQHREMVAQVMGLFALEAQRDLALMAPSKPSPMSPAQRWRACAMNLLNIALIWCWCRATPPPPSLRH